MCEDYRAGATADREHDDADRGRRSIACPVRSLWAGEGALPRFYRDPLEPWRAYGPRGRGRLALLVEDAPEQVGSDLAAFFGVERTAR